MKIDDKPKSGSDEQHEFDQELSLILSKWLLTNLELQEIGRVK